MEDRPNPSVSKVSTDSSRPPSPAAALMPLLHLYGVRVSQKDLGDQRDPEQGTICLTQEESADVVKFFRLLKEARDRRDTQVDVLEPETPRQPHIDRRTGDLP